MIIAVVGPTGVGKTKLSVALAKNMNAEIINADSMQVYKDLNIGTAKIKEEEKEGIVHHLFDICDINDFYTVYDYQKDARRLIDDILKRGKNVIFVGGTGLYLKAVLYDYQFSEGANYNDYSNLTNEQLYNKVKEFGIDNIHQNNRKRLVRMLNKIENNDIISNNTNKKLYDFKIIGLTTSRTKLYDIINRRVDIMINEGLLNEVESKKQYFNTSKALQTGIGYKEFIDYFTSNENLDLVINNIKKNSRHYAKRQYTFFNNQFDIKWFDVNYDDFDQTIGQVISYLDNI